MVDEGWTCTNCGDSMGQGRNEVESCFNCEPTSLTLEEECVALRARVAQLTQANDELVAAASHYYDTNEERVAAMRTLLAQLAIEARKLNSLTFAWLIRAADTALARMTEVLNERVKGDQAPDAGGE